MTKQNEWQSMDSAPLDGSWVLLLFKDEYDLFNPGFQIYEGYHSLMAWHTRDHLTAYPAYWMPLPLLPKESDNKE